MRGEKERERERFPLYYIHFIVLGQWEVATSVLSRVSCVSAASYAYIAAVAYKSMKRE